MREEDRTQYEVLLNNGSRYVVNADEAGGRLDGTQEVVRFWKQNERVATFSADHVVAYGRVGTVAKPASGPQARYMVTLPQKLGDLSSFAVFADEVIRDDKSRVYEFRSNGSVVVQIAEELVCRYMEPPARGAQSQSE